MTRTLICLALTAAAAAGCSSSGGAPTATATLSRAQRYMAALHDLKMEAVQAAPDGELLQLGRTACTYVKHPSEHPYGPVNDIVRNGYADAVTAAAVTKMAKVYLCPAAR